jgi:hypothetical protein
MSSLFIHFLKNILYDYIKTCLLDFICLAVLKAAGAGAATALFN